MTMTQAFALCCTLHRALAYREEVAFFQAIRAALNKHSTATKKLSDEQREHALRQIVSRAVFSDGVIDIFAAAGLKKPNIGILSEEFLNEVRLMPQRNLAVELLERLLQDEIKSRFATNVLQNRKFSELLAETLARYHNRWLLQGLADFTLDDTFALRSTASHKHFQPPENSFDMTIADAPAIAQLNPPRRILLGPGPSPVDDRVLRMMSAPLLGHLDPLFVRTMDEVQELLRYVFETNNRLTMPVSGTGSAGMEAAVVNLLEPDEEIVICINGYFGERMHEMALRAGAKPIRVECEWGGPVDLEKARKAWRESNAKVLFAVQAETSTGVLQRIEPLREIVDERDGFLMIDAVTSIGAHSIGVDRNRVDACYAGTQKALSCPPGLAPVTFSDRAVEKIKSRKTKVGSWYLDTNLLTAYWGETSGGARAYHHTAPITMNYALHEALRIVAEEGLENRAKRHERNHNALVAGVEAMGLKMAVAAEHRLWTLNAVSIPEGVDDASVRNRLLNEFNIEVGGGLGVFKGKVWRVGLMGAGSTENNVLLLLGALEKCLRDEGFKIKDSGVSAAAAFYAGG